MAGGWKQTRSAWLKAHGRDDAKPVNTYFVNLYETLAQSLARGAKDCSVSKAANTRPRSSRNAANGANGGSAGEPRTVTG